MSRRSGFREPWDWHFPSADHQSASDRTPCRHGSVLPVVDRPVSGWIFPDGRRGPLHVRQSELVRDDRLIVRGSCGQRMAARHSSRRSRDRSSSSGTGRQATKAVGRWSIVGSRADGHTTWVYSQAISFSNEQGQLAGYVGVNVDITHLEADGRRSCGTANPSTANCCRP